MGCDLIFPHLKVGINVIFGEILALTSLRHTENSKCADRNVVISNIHMKNALEHSPIVWKIEFSCQFHRQVTHNK